MQDNEPSTLEVIDTIRLNQKLIQKTMVPSAFFLLEGEVTRPVADVQPCSIFE
jgi:hypothetical protein